MQFNPNETGDSIDIRVKVTDNGIGIDAQDRANLFSAYFKTRDKRSRLMNRDSHGLGLHICKMIAKNLGGDLVLNAQYNDGAQFIFSFSAKLYKKQKPVQKKFKNMMFGKKKHKKVVEKYKAKGDLSSVSEDSHELLCSNPMQRESQKLVDNIENVI